MCGGSIGEDELGDKDHLERVPGFTDVQAGY
jgi:hypothetical protein